MQNEATATPTCPGDASLGRRPPLFPGGLKANTGASSGKKWEKLCSDSLYVTTVDGYNWEREEKTNKRSFKAAQNVSYHS